MNLSYNAFFSFSRSFARSLDTASRKEYVKVKWATRCQANEAKLDKLAYSCKVNISADELAIEKLMAPAPRKLKKAKVSKVKLSARFLKYAEVLNDAKFRKTEKVGAFA